MDISFFESFVDIMVNVPSEDKVEALFQLVMNG